jgi:hypothetical protein
MTRPVARREARSRATSHSMATARLFTEDQLAVAVNAVRSYDAVVVVGAGLSAFGYPMTAELPPLLWQAIGDVPGAVEELRRVAGRTGSAKEILSASPDHVQLGWQLAREIPEVRTAFQCAFARLDADREPSSAHLDLARLVHLGRVECVISYNWDSCLERAYEQTYGVPLAEGMLYKPHGDVGRPKDIWVLPDEAGLVPETVLARMALLRDRPRALVVVGYSGSDETVVEKLLYPLESRWPVIRVGPSAHGEGAVPGSANAVLAAMIGELEPQQFLASWRYVTFSRSRDFGAALRGERLRPIDVNACPELPAASRLADRIRASKFATVSGVSGSGKSITAFHAARRLNREGWAVVELRRPGVASYGDLTEFKTLPGPVLAVVDDAQAIEPVLLTELEAAVDDQHAVMLVSTQRLETRDDETLIAAHAQQVIYDYCLANIETVGSLLSQLDDRVAKSALAETPTRRLEVARQTTSQPWLFMFVASGGERRITSALDRAVERVQPAIILALICIAQMTSQDAGITRGELDEWLGRFAATNFPSQGRLRLNMIDTVLQELTSERLVSEHNGRLRAVHIRIADRALRDLGQRTDANIGRIALSCVRALLSDPNVSIIGKFWLFRTFDRVDVYRYRLKRSFLDDEIASVLVEQCQLVPAGRERGVGLNLIWSVDFIHPLNDALVDKLVGNIIEWLASIRAEETNGFQWVLSGLRSGHKAAHARIRDTASARELATSFSIRGTRATAMDWAHIIEELMPEWTSAGYSIWRNEFESGIKPEQLVAWLGDVGPDSHPFEIYEIINTLVTVSPTVAGVAFSACAPNIIELLERDFADAASNFSAWTFGIMYVVAGLADEPSVVDPEAVDDDSSEQDEEQGAAGSAFWTESEDELRELAAQVLAVMRSVDWGKAAQSLAAKEPFELESLDLLLYWLGRLSAEIIDQIAEAIPSEWLASLIRSDSDSQGTRTKGNPSAIDRLLTPLSHGPRGAAVVRRFLEEHGSESDEFPFSLITSFPDIAARMVRGKSVQVRSPRGIGWHSYFAALISMSKVDREAAQLYLSASVNELRQVIQEPQAHDLKGIDRFIAVADDLDPAILDGLLARLDPDAAGGKWRERSADSEAALRPLLERAEGVEGEIGQLARSLRRDAAGSPATTRRAAPARSAGS